MKNSLVVRASFGTSRWNNNIQTSPFEDVKIHDDVTIPHYVMEHWDEYGDSVALVGIERKLCKIY